jgi:hypothetical protein
LLGNADVAVDAGQNKDNRHQQYRVDDHSRGAKHPARRVAPSDSERQQGNEDAKPVEQNGQPQGNVQQEQADEGKEDRREEDHADHQQNEAHDGFDGQNSQRQRPQHGNRGFGMRLSRANHPAATVLKWRDIHGNQPFAGKRDVFPSTNTTAAGPPQITHGPANVEPLATNIY